LSGGNSQIITDQPQKGIEANEKIGKIRRRPAVVKEDENSQQENENGDG
jgi:hypothetical protein